MVTPIVALLFGFTTSFRTNPQVLHNLRKVKSLELGSSIVTIAVNMSLYYNKMKQINCFIYICLTMKGKVNAKGKSL